MELANKLYDFNVEPDKSKKKLDKQPKDSQGGGGGSGGGDVEISSMVGTGVGIVGGENS